MLKVRYSSKFKKDLRNVKKRNLDLGRLKEVILLLCKGNPLPENYREHALKGNYIGYMECHIQPDWLLIYKVEKEILLLTVVRTGTHSDLSDG